MTDIIKTEPVTIEVTESPRVQMTTQAFADGDQIWFATLSLDQNYDPNTTPPKLPDDGLADLLVDPWNTLNPIAHLPLDQPVTALFIYSEKGDAMWKQTLIAEGIQGTTFVTVRQEQPLLAAAMMGVAPEGVDARASLPDYYKSLDVASEPLEVITVGKLAYAHYHLSKDEAQIMGYRYAICRDPRYLPVFLNEKAKEEGIPYTFTTVTDGSLRVIYQTDKDSPNREPMPIGTIEETIPATAPVAMGILDPEEVNPCLKITGIIDGNTVIMDSVMLIRYGLPPGP